MMRPTARMNIARHADSSRHSCATVEIAQRGSLVTFSALTIQRFNLSTIHVATARVLLRDISKILFPDNPVNVPVIK